MRSMHFDTWFHFVYMHMEIRTRKFKPSKDKTGQQQQLNQDLKDAGFAYDLKMICSTPSWTAGSVKWDIAGCMTKDPPILTWLCTVSPSVLRTTENDG